MGNSLLAVIFISLAFFTLIGFIMVALKQIQTVTGQRSRLKKIMYSQRKNSVVSRVGVRSNAVDGVKSKKQYASLLNNEVLEDSKLNSQQTNSSKVTLETKFTYAQWTFSPIAYRAGQILVGILLFLLVYEKCNFVVQVIAFYTGFLIFDTVLASKIKLRFRAFDVDYPQFLASLVGLLKTGMNPMTAIAASSKALEADSLVRRECELMLERMRYGVSEDQSIGGFAGDVPHPEIELFVQALLLSRQVGGTLSDTLERLSKQVRRRQYFRQQAVSAVSMHRGSVWVIILLMIIMQGFLMYMEPKIVTESINDPIGWQVWQIGILIILTGILWVRKVTNIKV
jgi:tight adherence protein B